MFSALDKEGRQYVLYRKSFQSIEHLQEVESFYCPSCKETVVLRISKNRAPHFAHLPKSSCRYKGETDLHQKGKILLYEWLKLQQLDPKLEYFLPAISQRPDVYVEWKKRTLALEFQCSIIPPKEIRRRSRHYMEAGIIPIWIVEDRHIKGTPPYLHFSSFLQSFLYRFHTDLRFFSFSPDTHRFTIHHIQQSLSTRNIISLRNRAALSELRVADLFQRADIRFDWQRWLRSTYRYRTKPVKRSSRKESRFLEFLYLHRSHPSLLPSVCFLPLPSQPLYDEPAPRWQATFIFTSFHSLKIGEKVETDPVRVSDLLGEGKGDLMDEYLQELAYLGYVRQEGGDWYKRKDLSIPVNIEQAIRHDRELMVQLKNRDSDNP